MKLENIGYIMNYSNLAASAVNIILGGLSIANDHPWLGAFQLGCAAFSVFLFMRHRQEA